MRANGIGQGLPHSGSEVVSRGFGAVPSPVHPDVVPADRRSGCPVPHAQPVPGRQRKHVTVKRPRLRHAAPEIKPGQASRLATTVDQT